MLVDLHIHSTFSDGRYTPTELVQAAVAQHVGVIALTDHDSCNGYVEAVAAAQRLHTIAGRPLLRVLPGVELSTEYQERTVHVLGYHIDPSCQTLVGKMDDLRFKREHRLELMLEKCRALGMELQVEPVDAQARAVGRPHVAKAMVAQGYVQSVQEAFDRYLHRGGPCYVQQPKLSPKEAVELIHQAGGVAVLAHPSEITNPEVPEYLLSHIAFDGLEIWHPSVQEHSDIPKWLALARKYHLLTSGGSDFHGIPGRYPEHLGVWPVLYESTAAVIEYK